MEISITGLGMVSSVGWDVGTACASIRAGIARPAELEFTVLDPDADDEAPVVGHPISGLTEGFVLVGAWLRLALASLDDLALYASLPGPEDSAFWAKSAVLVVAPVRRSRIFQEMSAAPAPRIARLDCREVVLEGQEDVTLRCGRASLTLRRDGTITRKGVNVVSQAERVQKIRRGKVSIN
jgi:3-oxoacyl-[acyl-carrier-protein] synthase-1